MSWLSDFVKSFNIKYEGTYETEVPSTEVKKIKDAEKQIKDGTDYVVVAPNCGDVSKKYRVKVNEKEAKGKAEAKARAKGKKEPKVLGEA